MKKSFVLMSIFVLALIVLAACDPVLPMPPLARQTLMILILLKKTDFC
jgi:hypothetical protein